LTFVERQIAVSTMKLPFNTVVTESDVKRLTPALAGNDKLSAFMMMGVFSIEDIEKMVNMEAAGRKRETIFRRLVGRWCSMNREKIMEDVGFSPKRPGIMGSGVRGRPRKAV